MLQNQSSSNKMFGLANLFAGFEFVIFLLKFGKSIFGNSNRCIKGQKHIKTRLKLNTNINNKRWQSCSEVSEKLELVEKKYPFCTICCLYFGVKAFDLPPLDDGGWMKYSEPTVK